MNRTGSVATNAILSIVQKNGDAKAAAAPATQSMEVERTVAHEPALQSAANKGSSSNSTILSFDD
jgi:hypothetical protein